MQEDVVASSVIVLVGLLGAVLLLGMVAGLLFRRGASPDVAVQVAPPAPPPVPAVHGFPVITEEPQPVQPVGTGPGRYRVGGVVAATKVDVTLYVVADSPANAKVKAELSGVVVTDVSKAS